MELKTSEEWMDLVPHIIIMDADGWDRSNFQYSWYEEKITKEEFEKRVMISTIKSTKPFYKLFS